MDLISPQTPFSEIINQKPVVFQFNTYKKVTDVYIINSQLLNLPYLLRLDLGWEHQNKKRAYYKKSIMKKCTVFRKRGALLPNATSLYNPLLQKISA